MEIWKDIKGYEGLYQVSNYGRIKTLSRFKRSKGFNKEKILSPGKSKSGYLTVLLYKNNERKNKSVHRLVCEAFIKNKYNKKTVNHKDGNKHNNKLENLEWTTYSENGIHAFKKGLNKPSKGEKNGNSILDKQKVLEIRCLCEKLSNAEVSRILNVNKGTVSDVKLRKTWNHI